VGVTDACVCRGWAGVLKKSTAPQDMLVQTQVRSSVRVIGLIDEEYSGRRTTGVRRSLTNTYSPTIDSF
jgi:hypothetical protein